MIGVQKHNEYENIVNKYYLVVGVIVGNSYNND